MAVTVESLRAPRGEVEPWMFPQDRTPQALDARLQAYLDDAAAKLQGAEVANEDRDEVVRNYVFYRVFDAVYKRLVIDPSKADLSDQGGQQWIKEQLSALAEQRSYYMSLVPAFMLPQVVEVEEPEAPPAAAPRTLNIPVQVVF